MEEFFREVSQAKYLPTKEQVVNRTFTEGQIMAARRLFDTHGMRVFGTPLVLE